MNRETMRRILERTRGTGAVALAAPPTPATPDLPCPTSEGPRGRLWVLLSTWAGMDEAVWSEANVRALYDDIMDLFRDYREANAWFREWRAAHPEARW